MESDAAQTGKYLRLFFERADSIFILNDDIRRIFLKRP